MKLQYVLNNVDYNLTIGCMNIQIIRFTRTQTDGGLYAPPHAHKYYEFHYIKDGKGTAIIEGHKIEVENGDIFFTMPFVTHSQFSDECSPMMEFCLECDIKFDVESEFAYNKFEAEQFSKILNQMFFYSVKDNENIIENIDKIYEMNLVKSLGFYALSTVYLNEVVLKTLLSFTNNKNVPYPYVSVDMNLRRATMLKNFIDVNIKNKLTIEDASHLLFLSEKQVDRIMMEKFGQTFHDYLMYLRINTSKGFLKNKKMSIKLIAASTGFNSYQQFYRNFTKIVGINPKEYRSKYFDDAGQNIENDDFVGTKGIFKTDEDIIDDNL